MRNVIEFGTATNVRAGFLRRARQNLAEINQIFLDCEHWNSIHPNEQPIDADPDGQLRRIAAGLERWITAEAAKVGE